VKHIKRLEPADGGYFLFEVGGGTVGRVANADIAADIITAVNSNDALVEALNGCEWVGGMGSQGQYCPFCYGRYPAHEPDCKRQAALALVKKEE